jgi:WD40 repeat protein
MAVCGFGKLSILTGKKWREKLLIYSFAGSSGNACKIIPSHTFAVTSNAFSTDGSCIASGDASGLIKINKPM